MQTRYLLAYHVYLPDVATRYKSWMARIRKAGYDVEGFCITVDPPNNRCDWPELDKKWHRRDRKLMSLYEALAEKASNCHCMINLHGANLHPEFVSQLPTFNVFISNDDPESSDILSKPCAPAYDYCFTGNIACVQLYHSWGIKDVDFLPLGFFEEDHDPTLTEEDILGGDRHTDIAFVGECFSSWRSNRLDRIASAFPKGHYYGRGWPNGYISMKRLLSLYRDLKVGFNIHNSVGPVNRRTYALPANGVMQICDNRCRLGHLFKLSEEVIGVDSVDDMVEAARYYLAHDDERRRIAAAGWKRAINDYSELAVWKNLLGTIHEPMAGDSVLSEGRQASIWLRPSFDERLRYDLTRLKERGKKLMKKGLSAIGYSICAKAPEREESFPVEQAYLENPEEGPVNIEIKDAQVDGGDFFEWPNIVALNYAVASLVGPNAKKIIEMGGGTGAFAYEASVDPSRHVFSCELNVGAHEWAKKHRSRPNIDYLNRFPDEDADPYDLVVSIEVIEHIGDYFGFLATISKLAPRALLTTPNRHSKYTESPLTGPPRYEYHVREWTAGEFYWLLRGFYQEVTLYAMPNVFVPWCKKIDVESDMTPLIADCRKPYGR